MPPNRFESEVESFLEGSHGDRTHIKRADHPRLHHYAGRYLPGKHRRNPASITRTVLKPEPQVPHPYTGVNLDIGLSWIETMMASPANGLAKRRNRNPSDEETKLTLKAKPPCPGSA